MYKCDNQQKIGISMVDNKIASGLCFYYIYLACLFINNKVRVVQFHSVPLNCNCLDYQNAPIALLLSIQDFEFEYTAHSPKLYIKFFNNHNR